MPEAQRMAEVVVVLHRWVFTRNNDIARPESDFSADCLSQTSESAARRSSRRKIRTDAE